MATVVGFIIFGEIHQYHGGVQPNTLVQIYQNDTPSFVIYKQDDEEISHFGTYVPESDNGDIITNPVTDILLMTARDQLEKSSELHAIVDEFKQENDSTINEQLLNNDVSVNSELINKSRNIIEDSSSNLSFLAGISTETMDDVLRESIDDNLQSLKISGELLESAKEIGGGISPDGGL